MWSLLLSLMLLTPSAQAQAPLPVPEVEKLANGLELVWFVNDKIPVVDMVLLLKSGYRDDPKGKSGTTELLAATLDRGVDGLSAQAYAREVEMLGATRFIDAQDDSLSVGMHGLAPDANALMDLLAKLVLRPTFPKEEVEREKSRMLDRWRHLPDQAEALSGLVFRRALANNTPYARGAMQSAKDFAHVNHEDVMAMYQDSFNPENAILMVVGQVNKALLRKKIEERFGQWKAQRLAAPSKAGVQEATTRPTHARASYKDPRYHWSPGEILVIDRPGASQAHVKIGFVAPGPEVPEHYSLIVGNAMLGEHFNSRLNILIRDKLGLTYSIQSAFAHSQDLSLFAVSSATRNEATGQLVHKTLDVLKDFKAGPLPQNEVNMAKDYLLGGFPVHMATLNAVASRWLVGHIYGRGVDYLNEFLPKVEAVSVQTVAAGVQKHFALDKLLVVVSGDAKEITKSLRAAKFSRIRLIKSEDILR